MTRTRRQKRLAQRQRQATLNARNGCPTPGKATYDTRHDADDALGIAWRCTRNHGTPLPIRAYYCACGGWHLTKKPLTERRITP